MRQPSKSSGRSASSRSYDDHKNITVKVEHPDDIQKILNALTDAGASFLSLDVRKPNLEAVFLKLTGETLRARSAEMMPE